MESQARSSAIHRNLAAFLLGAMILTGSSTWAATTVVVGGKLGWTLGHIYKPITIKSGESVLFNYSNKAHNVLHVGAADYNSCNVKKPLRKYSSGADSMRFPKRGTYYFICGKLGHCGAGMKVTLHVE